LNNTSYTSKYEYEYDENVELPIYHPTSQSLCFNNYVNFLKLPNFLNIESFIIRIKNNFKRLKRKQASPRGRPDISTHIKNAGRGGPARIATPINSR